MLGAYDTRPPGNAASLPRCAYPDEHTAAVSACQPIALRGFGGLGAIGRFGTANPCWIATLPFCPPTVHEPVKHAAPQQPPLFMPQMQPLPQQAGMSTGGMLAIAAGALAVGAWIVFGRKKKQSA